MDRRSTQSRLLGLATALLSAAFVTVSCGGGAQPSTASPVEADQREPVPLSFDLGDAVADSEAEGDGSAPLPDVNFEWFDGRPGSTAEFVGMPTVLNFWQSYCPPCIQEMPEFEAVSQALAGMVSFVGMNVADTREAANDLAHQTGVTYPLADDVDSEVFRSVGGFVMPTTVFLDAQGRVAYVWSGALTGDELRILIDKYILPGGL